MSNFAFNASGYHHEKFDGLNRYTDEILRDLVGANGRSLLPFRIYTADNFLTRNYGNLVSSIPFKNIDNNDFKHNLTRLIWHQTLLPMSLMKHKINLFYSPVPEGMLFPVCPQIVTVHDILPIVFPESYPRVQYYFRYILPLILIQSKAIIAISDNTKKDIESQFDIKNKPIHVVYQGYKKSIFNTRNKDRDREILQKYYLKPFILCVGETRPYKNIRRLMEAFSRVKLPNVELAIVGKLNKLDREIVDYPRHLGIGNRVKFLGFVPDESLAALYRSAIAFAFPSLYEGFGIPLLEAMACGCPVIASHVASIPEVCGDAAEYVDPWSVESIATGIYRVATDVSLRSTLREGGLERVKLFNTHRMFEEIIGILHRYSR